MRGVVYGFTQEAAYDKLEEIIQNYESMNYTVLSKGYMQNSRRVVFNNNDIWEAYVPYKNMRGRAYNVAYIDHRIGVEELDEIIMPSIKASPYQAWKRF